MQTTNKLEQISPLINKASGNTLICFAAITNTIFSNNELSAKVLGALKNDDFRELLRISVYNDWINGITGVNFMLDVYKQSSDPGKTEILKTKCKTKTNDYDYYMIIFADSPLQIEVINQFQTQEQLYDFLGLSYEGSNICARLNYDTLLAIKQRTDFNKDKFISLIKDGPEHRFEKYLEILGDENDKKQLAIEARLFEDCQCGFFTKFAKYFQKNTLIEIMHDNNRMGNISTSKLVYLFDILCDDENNIMKLLTGKLSLLDRDEIQLFNNRAESKGFHRVQQLLKPITGEIVQEQQLKSTTAREAEDALNKAKTLARIRLLQLESGRAGK